MKLHEIIAIARSRLDDDVGPRYLVPDADFIQFANDAENEAAERSVGIYDTSTPEVVQLVFAAEQPTVALHDSVLSVELALVDGDRYLRPLPDPKYDRSRRANLEGTPVAYAVKADTISLFPTPKDGATVNLEVYRRPLTPMVSVDDTPEIAERHHRYLAHWMAYLAFERHDELGDGTYNPERAEQERGKFIDRFGMRQSARQLQTRREYHADTRVTPKYRWV